MVGGEREDVEEAVEVDEDAQVEGLHLGDGFSVEAGEEALAVLVGELGVAVGLPQLSDRVVQQIVVGLRQRNEGHGRARGAVLELDLDLQLGVVADFGADQVRVDGVLEEVQVADPLVGALQQVAEHRDHLVGRHVLHRGLHRVLDGEDHGDQDGLEFVVVLVHVGGGDVHIRGRKKRVDLHKVDLHIRGDRHEHRVVVHARLDAFAVKACGDVLEKAHDGSSLLLDF